MPALALPPSQGTIRIGTASWTDPTLIACGRFYPPHAQDAASRLRHYASQFPLVEVNSSYYAIGSPMVAHQWCMRTEAAFRFHVKAFRLFTGHAAPTQVLGKTLQREFFAEAPASIFYDDLPKDLQSILWSQFLESIEPLRLAGRLDTVHFQFAPWVRPGPRSTRRLEDIVHRMQGHTLCVEWRHQDWLGDGQRQRTLDWQRELGVAHTVVDSPTGFSNSVPAVWTTTHPDLAIVRLHGRNAHTWQHRGAASSGRFMYDYTEAEMAELAKHIRRLAQSIERTHVVLNTNYQDQGIRNARRLTDAVTRHA